MRTCPPRARAWYLAHPSATPLEAAAALDIAPQSARTYRHYLIKEGAIPSHRPRIDMDDMRERIEDGALSHHAARHAGISGAALQCRMCRAGIGIADVRADAVYSARAIGRILGVAHVTAARWLCRWHTEGRIEAHKGKRRGSEWRVPATALVVFLERPDCPITPEQIVDPEWRTFAEDARNRAHLRRKVGL